MALRGVDVDVGAGEVAVGDADAGVVEDEVVHVSKTVEEAVDEVADAVEAAVEDGAAGEAAVEALDATWGGVDELGVPFGTI